MSIESDIDNTLASMSIDQLKGELAKLIQRKEALKNRAKSSMTKEQRTAYYNKMRGEPGSPERVKWDTSRKRQADARKAKETAVLNLIKAAVASGRLQVSAEELKTLGITV